MRRAAVVFLLSALVTVASFASTYSVNDLGNANDATPGDDICATAGAVCTLQAAVDEANAHAGADTIAFSVSGTIASPNGYIITGTVTIDGTSSPGYAGSPVVIIGASSVVDSLEIYGFGFSGISTSAANITLQRNYIGPITGGTPNDIGISLGGLNNTVGGASGFGNVISGNNGDGILASGIGHTISDNFIGVDPAGTTALGNGGAGILVLSSNTLIGSATAGAENVISGNSLEGVKIDGGSNNTIAGNYIGTDATGTADIANDSGVLISSGDNNTIGAAGSTTLLSGNFYAGVEIFGGTGNQVISSFIGTDITGTTAVPNDVGIDADTSNVRIGAAGTGNLISGNNFEGIILAFSAPITGVVVQGNNIGLDITGLVGIGNGDNGITAYEESNLLIGGVAASGEGNIISFNAGIGILGDTLGDPVLFNTRLEGNTIGLDAPGNNIRGNSGGVWLFDSTHVTIGAGAPQMNVVSGNSFDAIVIAGGDNNIVQGNRVGTNSAGTLPLGNIGTGIVLAGTDAGIVRSNLSSGNAGHGIEITIGSTNAIVHSNTTGTAADLTTPMGNGLDGINVCDTASGTIVGSVALGGNLSAFNGANGLGVEPSALLNNTWAANSLHDNTDLGIDIGIDGVTPNDPGDEDIGANNLQNYPALAFAATNGTATSVEGTLNSTASSTFALHFYSSTAMDPSGFGEGQTYLGTMNVTTDGSGNASFIFNGPVTTIGQFITATATGTDGTSEFSNAQILVAAPTVQFSSAAYAIAENGGSATITVTRTGDLSGTSTVNYATSNGTAGAPLDYTTSSGTLTFAPTESSKTFSVPIINDTIDEPNETVNLTLSSPAGASLGAQPAATLTISDDDPTPSITINDITLVEGNAGTTAFTFTVTLSNASSSTVTVDYATANGSALAGSDYTAAGATLSFAPGVLTQPVTVNVTGDLTNEPNETFFVNLTNAINATISDAQGLGTINNDDPVPSMSINDVSLAEGNAGTTPFTFTVTLSNPSSSTVTVDYATAAATAIAGSDYNAATGTLTFAPGVITQPITVNVIGDTTTEPNETFFVNLTNAVNAVLVDNQATGTITNDDGVPAITINDVTLAEGNAGTTAFTFTVTLANPSAATVTVDFATANGTATAGSDYTAATGTLTFAPGVVTQPVTVNVNGDLTTEPNETFFVNLTNATNATIADTQGIGTITNDDAIPSITINDVTLAEGNAGTTAFTFTVTLSNPSASTVTVDFATANGTATAGSDYTAATGTLTFAPGVLTQPITINVTGESALETSETFFVNLTNAVNAVIADAQGIGTITNDDVAVVGADVSIVKTAIAYGTVIRYTIVVSNAGPAAATNVIVDDTPSPLAKFADITTTSGTCVSTPTIRCTIPSLASGASATITLQVTMLVPEIPPNISTVSATEPDPNPANNTSSASYPIPTMSEWLLIALAATLVVIAARRL